MARLVRLGVSLACIWAVYQLVLDPLLGFYQSIMRHMPVW